MNKVLPIPSVGVNKDASNTLRHSRDAYQRAQSEKQNVEH